MHARVGVVALKCREEALVSVVDPVWSNSTGVDHFVSVAGAVLLEVRGTGQGNRPFILVDNLLFTFLLVRFVGELRRLLLRVVMPFMGSLHLGVHVEVELDKVRLANLGNAGGDLHTYSCG